MSTAHLSRIALVSANPERLAQFYTQTFGFVVETLTSGIWLRLHGQTIELISFQPPGRAYPENIDGRSLHFQHFAIVVSNMQKAYEKLCGQKGWTPISRVGPERLPGASGGVSAFKFRDPEGHPLELIEFRTGEIPAIWQRGPVHDLCLGIDHSAISVADTARSISFYKEFGFNVSGSSLNQGAEQARLDAIDGAVVEVTSLAAHHDATPHVELLCYRGASDRPPLTLLEPNDIAATQLVFGIDTREAFSNLCDVHKNAVMDAPSLGEDQAIQVLLRDPDGHLIRIECNQPPVAKPG